MTFELMYRVTSPLARAARGVAAAFGMAAVLGLIADPARTQTPEAPSEDAKSETVEPPPPTERETESTYPYTPELILKQTGEEDDQIEPAVRSASLLFTYVDEPVDSVGILFTRGKQDRQRITRALNALGYFQPRISITIAGAEVDDQAAEDTLADKPREDKIPVIVTIEPGPLFTFGRVAIASATGTSQEPLAGLPADASGLEEGAPARSADVVAANARLVTALREQGFALATVVGREAVADHATAKLEVTFRVDPGAKAKFGDVRIEGTQDMEPDFVASLRTFEPGDDFKGSLVTDYQKEIERLGTFNSVAMNEAKSLDPQGRLPMTVTVTERKLHVVGVSASWSTLEGAAIGGYWMHRNLWGQAEQLRIDATSSRLLMNGIDDYEYLVGATLTKPAFPTKRDDLIVGLAAKRERPDAYERDAVVLDTRIRRRIDKELSGEAGLGFTQGHEKDALGERDRTSIQIPVKIAYDTRDNLLDSTRGYRLGAGVQPIININRGSGVATRFDAAGSGYWRLDENGETVLAARASLGASVADDLQDLPVDLRFFAGGGGSVRGYEYQALSPRNAVNQIIGGKSSVEGSVELRSWMWDDIGVAAFVDAGSASSANFPDFEDIGVGVGVGARYRTPVGPVRLDIAIPLDPPPGDADFGVYVALGQAF